MWSNGAQYVDTYSFFYFCLKSRQIDYIQAFPHAPLKEDVYMRIPEGWRVDPSTGYLAQVQGDPKFKDKTSCIKLVFAKHPKLSMITSLTALSLRVSFISR